MATTAVLSQLEAQLMVIHEVVSREEGNTKSKRDEIVRFRSHPVITN